MALQMYFECVGATIGRPRAFNERPYIVAVRIRLQTENARNASTKFRKTLELKKAEKDCDAGFSPSAKFRSPCVW